MTIGPGALDPTRERPFVADRTLASTDERSHRKRTGPSRSPWPPSPRRRAAGSRSSSARQRDTAKPALPGPTTTRPDDVVSPSRHSLLACDGSIDDPQSPPPRLTGLVAGTPPTGGASIAPGRRAAPRTTEDGGCRTDAVRGRLGCPSRRCRTPLDVRVTGRPRPPHAVLSLRPGRRRRSSSRLRPAHLRVRASLCPDRPGQRTLHPPPCRPPDPGWRGSSRVQCGTRRATSLPPSRPAPTALTVTLGAIPLPVDLGTEDHRAATVGRRSGGSGRPLTSLARCTRLHHCRRDSLVPASDGARRPWPRRLSALRRPGLGAREASCLWAAPARERASLDEHRVGPLAGTDRSRPLGA